MMFVSVVKYEENFIFHMGSYESYNWKDNIDTSGCNYSYSNSLSTTVQSFNTLLKSLYEKQTGIN